MLALALVLCGRGAGAGASPEWVDSIKWSDPRMSKSSLLSQERTANDRPDPADDPSVIVAPEGLSRQELKTFLGVSS